MSPFPVSSAVYIYSAAAVFSYGLWFLHSYKKTGNEYSKMFWRLGMISTLTFIFYGIPPFINPNATIINGAFHILGTIIYFIAMSNPLYVTLESWGKTDLARFLKTAVPFGVLFFGSIHILYIPQPNVDLYGIIHWNMPFPFNVVVATLGMLAAFIPGYFFFTIPTKTVKTATKKTLFAVVFLLSGLGGWSTILTTNTLLLAIAFGTMFLAFTVLWSMFLVELIMKEEKSALAEEKKDAI